MQRILVTGGDGFLGSRVVQCLLRQYPLAGVVSLGRDENRMKQLLTACQSDRVTPVIGDIRDTRVLDYALMGADAVVHLAAMKHVGFCEMYPAEAITTNVVATLSLVERFQGQTFAQMSTDKAVEAISCYGATKLLQEKLVLGASGKNEGRRFFVVRSGNILGASGSVLPVWLEQIRRYNRITVTEPKATRFFTDVDSIADSIAHLLEHGDNGSIYVLSQKVLCIGDLAQAFIRLFGNKDTTMETIGLAPGERLHEKLFGSEEVHTDLSVGCSVDAQPLTRKEIMEWLRKAKDSFL